MKSTSCGGVVIYRRKVLLLLKKYGKREGIWVLPKGTVELGETLEETALREVYEEAGVLGKLETYIGQTQHKFSIGTCHRIEKTVYWYLMSCKTLDSKPQRSEHFVAANFFDFRLAKEKANFENEQRIIKRGYREAKLLNLV